MSNDSIFALKKGFLESQVRHLTADIRPSRTWQEALPLGREADLSVKVVEQVLAKFNLAARKHHRIVYTQQAIRHVAEQIDVLYREGAKSEQEAPEGEAGVLRVGADFTDPAIIDALPEEYPGVTGRDSETDLERYQFLRTRLINSALSSKAQQQRLMHYEKVLGLLEPFRDPQITVQPNLVTRGGPMDQELEKMRMLALRLSVQIDRAKEHILPARDGEDDDDDDEQEEEEEGVGQKMLAMMAAVEGKGTG